MKYNDYVKGKELYKKHVLINEDASNSELLEEFNLYIKEHGIDKLEDIAVLENLIMSLSDDIILEAKGEPGIFKKIMGRIRLRKAVNKYVKAYASYRLKDVEFEKMKTTDAWKEAGPGSAKRTQIEKSFQIEKDEAKAMANEIANRITEIGKEHGIPNIASALKYKAKIKAMEKVRSVAKSIYSDDKMKELNTEFEDLQIKATKADKGAEIENKQIENDPNYKEAAKIGKEIEKYESEIKELKKELKNAAEENKKSIEDKIKDAQNKINKLKEELKGEKTTKKEPKTKKPNK